jgi:hypothetical protein
VEYDIRKKSISIDRPGEVDFVVGERDRCRCHRIVDDEFAIVLRALRFDISIDKILRVVRCEFVHAATDLFDGVRGIIIGRSDDVGFRVLEEFCLRCGAAEAIRLAVFGHPIDLAVCLDQMMLDETFGTIAAELRLRPCDSARGNAYRESRSCGQNCLAAQLCNVRREHPCAHTGHLKTLPENLLNYSFGPRRYKPELGYITNLCAAHR